MASLSFFNICILLLMVMASASGAHSLCEGQDLSRQIQRINSLFPSVGVILQSDSQLKAFLQSSTPFPYLNTSSQIDISGRRFHVRFFASHIVVMVSAGTGMLNAGTTAELMLTHFPSLKVVHYGNAGNADSNLNTGDIVVPRQWAHTGLWEWQRNGEEKKLGVASLKFADYNSESVDNDLYRVWFQSEEVYTTPEAAKHVFWVNVSENYYAVTEKLTQVELDSCAESDMSTSVGKPSSCLSYTPKVVRVERGSSANIYVDNVAYRKFLRKTFDITAIDEDSAAIALVCERLKKPFVSFRTLSDLAGAGSSENEEAAIAYKIANKNGVKAVSEFVKLLPSPRMQSAEAFAIKADPMRPSSVRVTGCHCN